ncbi:Retrovirus-related Pol polyprotein from transposon RE1 [Vitis vinifera]|uniref:Retrovirus-related Pol polyprotein from transposon RE1 n=1 Tax=Vitis vinifera TaxID=29760 RepID=A0A438C4S3_VITVI|nr:Retrovirus-related Pol polyprotein from transposon RE1 [Vitis vinifera]
MFSTLLYGYDLIGYVDGTYPSPLEMIKMGDTFTPNPEHKIWKRQESLLLHAIMESVDSTIAPLVASTTFAQEAWARLYTTYASKLKTRILGLREMLSQLIKENKSVVEYMTVIKTMSDELAIVGSPLGAEEMVISVLKDHEMFLKREEFKKDSVTVTTQFNQKGSNNFGKKGNNSNNKKGQSSQFGNNYQGNKNHHGHMFPNQGNRFLGPQGRPPFNPPQICVVCQLCDKARHTARVCRSRPSSYSTPQANFMAREPPTHNAN